MLNANKRITIYIYFIYGLLRAMQVELATSNIKS